MAEGKANCMEIIFAILLPPLVVLIKFGCSGKFCLCLLLTMLGYVPGIIYALRVVTK